MTTQKIIEGLNILEEYRDKPDGYHTGADHDILYAYATDRPLGTEDLARMKELGWFQEGHSEEACFYDPKDSWCAFV